MDKITPYASKCRVATAHESVLNTECAYTFHNPFTTDQGIVVNLMTFIGTVDSMAFGGAAQKEESIYVRIVKKQILKDETGKEGEGEGEGDYTSTATLEEKVTKLGVGIDGGFKSSQDNFETISSYSIVILASDDQGSVSTVVELPFDETTKNDFPMNITASAESVIHHTGVATQQDLKAWELDDEKVASKYAESLEFVDNGVKISPNPKDWKCEKSGATENLWLNLSTGFIGGGRKNWDGSGGSNGALDYYLETGEKYPLVVKLGTITEDIETADCYSYAKDEDGPVKIPNLTELLQKRGIKVTNMKKTVKSTAELEVELNANYAFDAITEAGSKLVPVSGPGMQGLQNLGNSCYVNSIVQMLFSGVISELSSRYGVDAGEDVTSNSILKTIGPKQAPDDLLCQVTKLTSALTSGKFVPPTPREEVDDDNDATTMNPKYRLPPRMFKHLVGQGHVDFCTGQQQDAAQYLQYLLEKLDNAEAAGEREGRLVNTEQNTADGISRSTSLFAYKTMSRLVCSLDNKIKYSEKQPESILSLRVPMPDNDSSSDPPDVKRQKSEVSGDETKMETNEEKGNIPTVTFQSCLDAWSASHTIDGLRWSHLNDAASSATEQIRFVNFPRYLMVQIQRYELGPVWTPRKLEVNIDVPNKIDLNFLKTNGPQDGEDIAPEETTENDSEALVFSAPQINEGAIGQLMDMGFSLNGCKRALTAVGGSDAEAVMNWIFEHNSDPDFNDPIPEGGSNDRNSSGPAVDENIVSSLVENLGCFTSDQVRAALKECGGQADRAADWLFSHMDDLDGAIAMLHQKEAGPASNASSSSSPLSVEDGDGVYNLVGLVSHIGKNTGSGHYVAHLKKDGKWVIFNDEKVALSETPPICHAYLYLFQRVDSIGSPNTSY